MPLNDLQIRRAKPSDKKQTLSDGGGLALVISPVSRGGTKYFVYNYRFHGRQQSLRLGKYPDIGLSEAREKHQQARQDLAKGINPSEAKQQAKIEQQAALLHTFEHIARAWHHDNLHRWQPAHAGRIMSDMEKDVFPAIGSRQIDEIGVADVKALVGCIVARGATVTAEKVRQWIAAIYGYAAMLEITDRNPAAPLRGYFDKKATRHMPALPQGELTEFYRRLLLADIDHRNRIALLLTMLVFVRSTELRGSEWPEVDFANAEWVIPAARMKMKRSHTVPLADWPLALLEELHGLSGSGCYLFPSRTATHGFISEATLPRIIERMGYKGIATPHGFRSLASTVLNEQGFNPDAIEHQLAHVPANKIRAAYNRADYMAERRKMMQWYSDYLRRHYEAAQALLAAD